MTLSKGRGHLNRDVNSVKEQSIKMSERRPLLVERRARAKSQNQEHAGDDIGATRRPPWLSPRERERVS